MYTIIWTMEKVIIVNGGGQKPIVSSYAPDNKIKPTSKDYLGKRSIAYLFNIASMGTMKGAKKHYVIAFWGTTEALFCLIRFFFGFIGK